MKTMRKKILISILFIIHALLITQCKEDIPAIKYKEQGFFKGTITGTTSNGAQPFTKKFNYTRYVPALELGQAYSYYAVNDDGEVQIFVFREDPNTGGFIEFEFYLDDLDYTTPLYEYFSLTYIEDTNELLKFSMYNETDNDFTLTNFSFDITTGKLKGEFSLTGSENSTENEASVTGSFDIVLKRLVE